MPQQSVIYAVTRTKVQETRLLSQDRLLRLLESADTNAALYALSEMGYGGQDNSDFEVMINEELIKTARYMDEVTPNKLATDVLRLKYDCQNVKAVLKCHMLQKTPENLIPLGTVEIEELLKAGENGNFFCLPGHMQKAAEEIYQNLELGNVTPSAVDCALDIACYEDMAAYAAEAKVPVVQEMVTAQADFANLLMSLRVRDSEEGEALLSRALVPGGRIERRYFIQSLSQPADALYSFLGLSMYEKATAPGMQEYVNTGKLTHLERLLDDYILEFFKEKRNDSFSIVPVIGFQLAKEREAQAVRLLMVAKANNMPTEMVRERLRELYE
ncbi:V-type ATPase subunit [Eubacteriales bacterium OttesenSCG-928-M02]|nr:V-type ATPase subunit [Eubacteriales bacterium OttesenSCG-928-M02]